MEKKAEISSIFHVYGEEYKATHRLTFNQHKSFEAIKNCRTPEMGGHVNQCNHCGHKEQSYNSCRNRHCPKCGQVKQLKWSDKLKSMLLPVHYFHIVFTLPQELRKLIYHNQFLCYNILFKTSAQALQQAALNPEYLGAETGCVAVLHTWGQNLQYHPHLHMIVPAGGLDPDGNQWKQTGKNFFVPLKALMKMFRAKYIDMLIKEHHKGKLIIPPDDKEMYMNFSAFCQKIKKKDWNVYSKKAFGGPSKVVNYLGRYTHRVAITNNRILNIENGKIKFRWKDYSNNNKWKEIELEASEFIRRFMLHILPEGFYKVRYFGIFANVYSKTKRKECFLLLEELPQPSEYDGLLWFEVIKRATGKDYLLCPECKKGRMLPVKIYLNTG